MCSRGNMFEIVSIERTQSFEEILPVTFRGWFSLTRACHLFALDLCMLFNCLLSFSCNIVGRITYIRFIFVPCLGSPYLGVLYKSKNIYSRIYLAPRKFFSSFHCRGDNLTPLSPTLHLYCDMITSWQDRLN